MPRFADTLAAFQGLEGELPTTWGDDLTGAYSDDLAEVTAVSTAADSKIAELTAALSEAQAELQATKAANYDLLMQVAADSGTPTEEADSDSEGDDSDSDEDGEKDPIDSLFA